MTARLQDFLQALADDLMEGNFAEAARYYSFPLAVYVDGGLRVEKNAGEAVEILAERRAGALGAGATSIRVTVESITESADGRSEAVTLRRYIGKNGKEVGYSRIRYFCRPVEIEPYWTIEILELLELAFPLFPQIAPGSRKN